MKLIRTFTAAVAATVFMASGCTSMNPVVRAQSPTADPSPIQQTNFQVKGIESHPVYDATLGRHANTSVSYHDNSVPFAADSSCPGGPGCPNCPCPTGQGGIFNHGHGHAHYGAYGCPNGQCNHMQHICPTCVRDSRSYSYKAPNDLRYPMQNQMGGTIVYPYYTHKGPSDFFRQ